MLHLKFKLYGMRLNLLLICFLLVIILFLIFQIIILKDYHNSSNVRLETSTHENKIMKVFIMTRNEWPMIKSNILYHGSIFGFNNIHVIDASTITEQVNFLRTTRDNLGVNVYFSTANLNKVEDEFNSIMTEEKKYCDFIIKIDTDEIICNYDEVQKLLSVDRLTILSHINNLVYNGSKYKVGFQALNRVRDNCSDEEDTILTASDFSPVFKTKFKTFVPSISYKHIDIGGHTATISKPYDNSVHIKSNLTILHFHFHCFGRYVALFKQAVIRHGHLSGRETEEEEIVKLEANPCVQLWKEIPKKCGCVSCHKVGGYYSSIKNRTYVELDYIQSESRKEGDLTFKDLNYKLTKLHEIYKWLD